MKKKFLAPIVLAVMLIAPSLCQAGFNWQKNLDETLKMGKEKNIPVFAYFYHPYDNKEDKQVWMSPLLAQFYSKFLAVGINIISNSELAGEYGTRVYPSVLFFDPLGREIYALRVEESNNVLQRTELALRMKKVLQSIDEFSLLEGQLETTRMNPKMLLLYAKGLRDRAIFDKADAEFNRLFAMPNIDSDLMKEAREDYSLMVFLKATRDFYKGDYDLCIDALKRFMQKNPESTSIYHAQFILGIALYESGNQKEGVKELGKLSKDSKAGVFQEKAEMYLKEKKGGK
ncbi:MAG: hypothetical protein AB1656_04055 [Candidatus Omnitrophota bacterium]